MFIPAMVDEEQIAKTVDEVASSFGGDVARIRYTIREDTVGDPGIFFRIVLRETALTEERRPHVTAAVTDRLTDFVRPYRRGLIPYFNFRSESSPSVQREPEWM